jgi:hypothetical protein
VPNDQPERSEWADLLQPRHDPADGPLITVIMEPAGNTWSSPLKVTGDDNRVYFAKFPELCTGPEKLSVVTEMVVARAGRLIGASTCETVIMRVPPDFQGEPLKNGITISSGVVHASVAIKNCNEVKADLPERAADDNRRRHVGLCALYDWCMGQDQQWLLDVDDSNATYSHDHGHYLPGGGGSWSIDALVANVDQAHPAPGDLTGLSQAAITETASALRAVDRDSLRALLQAAPLSWAVTNEQLECLGWFLERRAPAVAGRIEQLAGS